MSKRHEALQTTAEDQGLLWKPTLVSPPKVEASGVPNMEPEMLILYHTLENACSGLEKKAILFLGTRVGEGASTVVSALARVAAVHFGRKVAILDTDTLNGVQHKLFGVNHSITWNQVLDENEPIEKAIYQAQGDRIWVVPGSPSDADTVNFPNTLGIEVLLTSLRERFDLVLIDSAPLSALSQGIFFAGKVDGVVMVLQAEASREPVVKAQIRQIINAGGKLVGTVLNKRRYYIPEFIYRKL